MSRPHWRLPAFRPRARRRDGNTCRTCYEMSCFVMRAGRTPLRRVMECHDLHADGACTLSGPGMERSFRAGASGIPSRFPGPASSAWAVLSIHLRSVLPIAAPNAANIADGGVAAAARLPGAAGPCFARILRGRACARPRAFRGGAVRAPDYARETQGAPLPCVSQGFFRAGTNGETKRPRECRFLPPATHDNTVSIRSISKLGKYFIAGIARRFHRAIRSA